MGKRCFKCGYTRSDTETYHAPDYECPQCGAVYAKVEAAIQQGKITAITKTEPEPEQSRDENCFSRTQVRSVPTLEKLQEAIKTGEILTVSYSGGSQPGAIRKLAPISIEHGKVRARCYNSDAVKQFVIHKITILPNEELSSAAEWRLGTKNVTRYESIHDLAAKEMDALSALGWHIESCINHLSLHRRFKNGKPMKGEDVSLNFDEHETTYLVLLINGEFHKEKRKSPRPWSVRGKNQNTRSYGSLDKAAVKFIEWAELLAPAKPHH